MLSESCGTRASVATLPWTWGPNVKVLCLEEDLDHLVAIFEKDYRLIVSKTKDLSDEDEVKSPNLWQALSGG